MKTLQFLHLGGAIHEDADLLLEIDQRVPHMREWYNRFGPALHVTTTARLSLEVRMLKAEVIETMLYGCVT